MKENDKTKYSCFFLEEEQDMHAIWHVCTFNKHIDEDYWTKAPYCENHDECPYYYPHSYVYKVIHNIAYLNANLRHLKKKENENENGN